MAAPRLTLSRDQILAHRRRATALDERLPPGAASLRRAAWAGLQDSMPRAAVLSIHARVERTGPSAWEDSALVQIWGPRYSAYVVPAEDAAVFTIGRLPRSGQSRRVAQDTATRLDAFLDGRTMSVAEAGAALGIHPNALRYGASTGRIRIRWDGARQPTIWTVPAPHVDEHEAGHELARRYLHVFGPSTGTAFADWAGIPRRQAIAVFDELEETFVPVRTPVGEGWILSRDSASFESAPSSVAGVRLLPSGDTYFLLQGLDRELLVPDADQRATLWTPRVWPGALLLDGLIIGTWRRSGRSFTIDPWSRLSPAHRDAVEAEAGSLPLPDPDGRPTVAWENATA